jgi:erythromycin esterase
MEPSWIRSSIVYAERHASALASVFVGFCSTIVVVASAIAATSSETGDAAPSDAIQAWISENAVPIRSIDATDDNYSDLEPLGEAIGSARVVQLGEPSHGAGSSFAAKVRLIKFLHQRMGFDVVAWESGLYELRLAQAAMRGGEDPISAAQRGILTIWSDAEEVRPLFEYMKASQASTHPLEMAGFDMQVRIGNSAEQFAADLRSFARALHEPELRRHVSALVDQTLSATERIHARHHARSRKHAEASKLGLTGAALQEAMKTWDSGEGLALRPKNEDLRALVGGADDLLATIQNQHAAFEQVHGTREITFMEHAISSMRGQALNVYDRERSDPPAAVTLQSDAWNRRDSLMANNLRWLIEKGYPGRKVIVWAHNAHLMNAYFAADWRSVHNEPQSGGMTPTGVFLSEWLKNDVYTIALTTYAGQDEWANGQRRGPIAPAEEGSFESKLHKLGKPYLFLDFGALADDPAHPMRTPQSMRVSGYGPPTSPYGNDTVPDLTKAFDAVFYIDQMAPATRIRRERAAN